MANRTFETKPATRESVPLLIGLAGPSGGGKTFSALRLATGIQKVTGGDVHVIDTEARRALHYADRFTFKHTQFDAPFGPLDYLWCIEHVIEMGAKIVIIDSMSHEHEGPGGVLEMHDAETKRMGGEKHTFRAWAKPKAERRRLINTILQKNIVLISCFRAKQKTKPNKKTKELDDLGWMAIAGDEFVYEQTVSMLLPPGAGGVPEWKPDKPGERAMVKLPVQFTDMFKGSEALSEDNGEAMARWAAGEAPAPYVFPKGEFEGCAITTAPAEYLTRLINDGVKGRVLAECENELGRRMKDDAAE